MQVCKLQPRIRTENGSTNYLEDRGTVTLVGHVRQVFHTKKHFIFRYQIGRDRLSFFQPSLNLSYAFGIPCVNEPRYQCHTIIAVLRCEIYICGVALSINSFNNLIFLDIVHKSTGF